MTMIMRNMEPGSVVCVRGMFYLQGSVFIKLFRYKMTLLCTMTLQYCSQFCGVQKGHVQEPVRISTKEFCNPRFCAYTKRDSLFGFGKAKFQRFFESFILRKPVNKCKKFLGLSGVSIEMGVLTDKHFSGSGSSMEKRPLGGSEQISNQLQLLPVVVQAPYPTSAEEMDSLQNLKQLVNEDETIRDSGVDLDDEFLLAFTRGKKYDNEKALKVLHNYVQVRKVKYNKFFQSLSPRKFENFFQEQDRFCGVLRHPDSSGRCVGVGMASLYNTRKHNTDAAIEMLVVSGMELLRTDNAPRNGLVLVIDASGFGLRHAREFTMSRIYMFLQIFLSSYPIKYKGFHIMNNSYIFDTILTIIKQLIPKKLRERIHLHGNNYESLYKYVPKEILPQSFGGPLSDEEAYHYEFENRIISKTEYYEKMGTNW